MEKVKNNESFVNKILYCLVPQIKSEWSQSGWLQNTSNYDPVLGHLPQARQANPCQVALL